MVDEKASPLCLGTAGHVDHGKTWLVRALTGKDTDRLPEEKARGMSIDLGYAPLELPGGRRLSVIDVPGHERFVRTMVAGATGIHLFLLVIDAAERARRQTHEHLQILRLLGVEVGVVAVTKADLVDESTLVHALREARGLVPEAAAVAVSVTTGQGLQELRAELAAAAQQVRRDHAQSSATRLYVDRSFTLHGIGTVATGTLWSGSIGTGDRLRVEPHGMEVRVRSVQVHDHAVERAEAGQRVAAALAAPNRLALRRGDVLVEPDAYHSSYRLDVALEELEHLPRTLSARVHHGTAETPARIVRVGERFAQLRLTRPTLAGRADRVVLRTHTTVAGGRVLDPAPPRHADIERFELLERGIQPEAIDGRPPREHSRTTEPRPRPSEVERPSARDVARLHEALAVAGLGGLRIDDRALAAHLESEGRAIRLGADHAISTEAYEAARAVLVDEAAASGAISLGRFRDLLGISRRPAQLLLERFDTDRLTRRVGDERILRRRART